MPEQTALDDLLKALVDGQAELRERLDELSRGESPVPGTVGAHALVSATHTAAGLTTGQPLRATSATAFAFGALDLANANAVTGALPLANGGTGLAAAGLTTGQSLRATGAAAVAFGSIDLANASAVTGVLPVANLGTTQTPTFGGLNVGAASGAAAGEINTSSTIRPIVSDAGTTNVPNALVAGHRSSGTPANGFGVAMPVVLNSNTTPDNIVSTDNITWVDATHATRKARRVLSISDFGGTREYLRGEGSGTAPLIGFLGANAVARQAVAIAAVSGGAGITAGAFGSAAARDAAITLINNMRTALINLGLVV